MSKGKPLGPCKPCKSEIVASVNDGVFRDGECGGCEYGRYRNHAELVQTLTTIRNTTESLDYDDYDVMSELKAKEAAHDEIRDLAYEVLGRNADLLPDRREST